MKRCILFAVLMLLPALHPAIARFSRFSDYMYIADTQVTRFNEIIWFWTADTMTGKLHLNDYIGIKYQPQFRELVTTSKGHLVGYGTGYFAYEPIFNFPRAVFPEQCTSLRAAASSQGHAFGMDREGLQFRCKATEHGWMWYAWKDGVEFDSTDVDWMNLIPYEDSLAVFFNGPLQIFGDHVSGGTTIGAAGTIRIMDDITYDETGPERRPQLPEGCESVLGLVSEKDILVANTRANGRGNGMYEPGGHDRKHVIITAAMLALDESIEFEDQNDSWDDYIWCDPDGPHAGETDVRGYIYLLGSIAFKRRGYFHRNNCGGTGYGQSFLYDQRLLQNPPPYYPEIDWDMAVTGNTVWRDTTVTVDSATYALQVLDGSLTLGEGAEIVREDNEDKPLIRLIGSDLYIDGTAENPVRMDLRDVETVIPMYDPIEFTPMYGESQPGERADTLWSGLVIEGNRVAIDAPWKLQDFTFRGERLFLKAPADTGDYPDSFQIDIDRSRFEAEMVNCVEGYTNAHWGSLTRSVFERGLHSLFENIDRCTFGASDTVGIINLRYDATIRNSFFIENRYRIVSGFGCYVDYCGYENFDGIHPFVWPVFNGDHILEEVEPLFIDPDNGDYRLWETSPLIDAGDPDSPPDPDGTVADIGAFYFHQSDAPDNSATGDRPVDYAIERVYPNPFNSSTQARIAVPRSGKVRIVVYDVLGREVLILLNGNVSPGRHLLPLDMDHLPSGLYFLRMQAGEFSQARKLLLVK